MKKKEKKNRKIGWANKNKTAQEFWTDIGPLKKEKEVSKRRKEGEKEGRYKHY